VSLIYFKRPLKYTEMSAKCRARRHNAIMISISARLSTDEISSTKYWIARTASNFAMRLLRTLSPRICHQSQFRHTLYRLSGLISQHLVDYLAMPHFRLRCRVALPLMPDESGGKMATRRKAGALLFYDEICFIYKF